MKVEAETKVELNVTLDDLFKIPQEAMGINGQEETITLNVPVVTEQLPSVTLQPQQNGLENVDFMSTIEPMNEDQFTPQPGPSGMSNGHFALPTVTDRPAAQPGPSGLSKKRPPPMSGPISKGMSNQAKCQILTF